MFATKLISPAALLALFMFDATAGESTSKTIELRLSAEIPDLATCERALAHFDHYCDYFGHVEQAIHPGEAHWSRGGLRYAWFDFDADGRLDLFVRNGNADWCGTLGCGNTIIFADLAKTHNNDERIYLGNSSIHSDEPVFLHFAGPELVSMSFGNSEHRLLMADEKNYKPYLYERDQK